MSDSVTSSDPPADPLIGTELGGYRIEAFLGAGPVGKVYRARQVSLDRPVALKVLRPGMATREEVLIRFRREAKAAATIKHPHLIEVFDFGEAGGLYYYAMELVEGRSLARYLERGEKFTERECIEVGRQALSALDAAHKAGIVHRDVEPGNLLLDPKGRIKLGDLGLAHFSEAEADPALTQPGISMGTPGYMSPEQVQGLGNVDYRSDFYGLGATLFHLAASRPPFEGHNLFEVITSHLNAPVPSVRDVDPGISKRFSDLIGRLMAKNPDDRPQTHTEIYEELKRCRQPEPEAGVAKTRIPYSEAATIERQRRQDSWIVAATAVAVIAVVVLGILALRTVLKKYHPDTVLGKPGIEEIAPSVAAPGPDTAPARERGPDRPVAEPAPPIEPMVPAEPDKPMESPRVPTTQQPARPLEPAPVPTPMPAAPAAPEVPPETRAKAPSLTASAWQDAVEAIIAPLREIQALAKQQSEDRIGRYIRDLEDVEKKVAARGDLDGALTVKEERGAWSGGSPGGRGGADQPSAPSELRGLRQFVDRDLQVIAGRKEVRWQAEKTKALAALRVIELRLTRLGRLDAALAVRGAMARIERGEVPETPLSVAEGKSTMEAVPAGAVGPMRPGGDPGAASKDHPFVNSLGMRFVPVKGTRVLFSIWETRVGDYMQFVRNKSYTEGGESPFAQEPDHPMVMVNWHDAQAFCEWLSEKEGLEYRLPTGQEWSMAVGKDEYPWGDDFPPPRGAENLAGEEAKIDRDDPSGVIAGWRDDHARTAPVGSYRRNRHGLYDLGGNVWEWCEDVYTEGANGRDFAGEDAPRLGRGGHWAAGAVPASVASARQDGKLPERRDSTSGFRCVIVLQR